MYKRETLSEMLNDKTEIVDFVDPSRLPPPLPGLVLGLGALRIR
jgi:hypothetical protein